MTDKPSSSKASKPTREERLAENLRANLRRRKQAIRKSKMNNAPTTDS